MVGQVARGFSLTFTGSRKTGALLMLFVGGAGATTFYLFLLPSPAVGGISPVALHYLTPPLTMLAILFGFGLSATLALNFSAVKRSKASGAAGLGGLLTSVLPASLCCTSVVPSLLALAGASAPTIIGSTGKIQSIFALHENVFLGASLTAVLVAVVLAARNAASSCGVTGQVI